MFFIMLLKQLRNMKNFVFEMWLLQEKYQWRVVAWGEAGLLLDTSLVCSKQSVNAQLCIYCTLNMTLLRILSVH